MAKITVIGAAGRMGRHLVTTILSTPGMSLAGAVEHPASEFLDRDAAVVAGLPACGVKITASLEEALKNADAVIDFSTGPRHFFGRYRNFFFSASCWQSS